jgi:hypothetical protein
MLRPKSLCVMALVLLGLILLNPSYAVDWQLSWTATGESADNYFGVSVSTAGDVNGDGYDDVIIGAHHCNAGGTDAGRAYIYYGGGSMDNIPDVTMTGEAAYDYFGVSVSTAGDVNGDGYDDVIVGVCGSGAGRAYIYYGGASMDNTPDVTMTAPASGPNFGFSVSTAGDVNNDGYDDVIVGTYIAAPGAGRAYIYFGGGSMDNTPDVTMTGEAAGDYFGVSVSNAGDVNNDGYGDVIVGAYNNDAGGASAGRAYIYFGGSSMDNTPDVTMTGEAASDQFGCSVSTAGDVNNDEYDDVIVGAHYNDAGGTEAGRAYIYFGGASMDNTPDVTMTGQATGDYFGYSVSTAGDVNGNGYADVIVGAYYNDAGGSDAGRAYIYYGSGSMDNIPDVTMTGEAAGDCFGVSVSNAGDVNSEGYKDVIIGARDNDAGGSDAGRAYIYSPYVFILLAPDGGETWNVGAIETVTWKGTEKADLYLSVDGGASYEYKIIENIGGADSNFFSFRVPHTPSRFSRIMIVETGTTPSYPMNFDISDSFFTIQSTITLLAFTAFPGQQGGAQLTWNTEPCIPDIQGYNLYYSNTGTTDFEKLNNEMITENEYSDETIRGGVITYRLGAVNGWGQEYIVGDIVFTSIEQPLIIYPSMLKDKGTVVFWFSRAFPGETETYITVSIYDVLGKKVKTLVNQKLTPGFHTCQFDGKDENGAILSAGTYFIIMKTPNHAEQAKFIKLR